MVICAAVVKRNGDPEGRYQQSLIKVALASEVINSLIRLERLIDYMWTRNLCFCRLVALRNAELDS